MRYWKAIQERNSIVLRKGANMLKGAFISTLQA